MFNIIHLSTALAAALLASLSLPASAEPPGFGSHSVSSSETATRHESLRRESRMVQPAAAPVYRRWMSPEIRDAWNAGFRGQGTRIVFVDDFLYGSSSWGNLNGTATRRRHGGLVRQQASMIAPSAEIRSVDFNTNERVVARSTGLTVVNLSYGIMGAPGYPIIESELAPQERSLLVHARRGTAVLVKAAGNDAVAVGGRGPSGNVDYLALGLIGKPSTIFVGALDRNGTRENKSRLASYSNRAGANRAVQDRFLSVGVREDLTGLAGTSFAAPIVSGYAAILGSKFKSASPTQISKQLLNTARTDTIHNYRRSVHGRGEASISRAIAPARIR